MARVRAVLKAVGLALWRERRSLLSVTMNNFFLTIGFFFFFGNFVDYTTGIVFYSLLGAVLLFPLSAHPLEKIPPERLALWPLRPAERYLLAVLAPWLNPTTWLLAALIIWSAVNRDMRIAGISAAVMITIPMLSPALPQRGRRRVWRMVPRMPGALGELIRNNLRQLLATLDFWLAALLAAIFLLYRAFTADVPSEAQAIFSLLIVLALSTIAQTFFALDGPHGMVRYRLLPITGSQALTAKAAAWLAFALLLTIPASILVGFSAALGTLPLAFWTSVRHPARQRRWRFSSTPAVWNSIGVVLTILGSGVVAYRLSAWWTIPPAIASLLSLWLSGRAFEQNLTAPR